MSNQSSFLAKLLVILVLFVLLVACGGGSANRSSDGGSSDGETSASSAASDRRGSAVPTMPSASFQSVGEQSGITETVGLTTTESVDDVGPDLALGQRVYTNNCAECHGAAGEGGEASSVVDIALDENAFETLIRTGGDVGDEHLFGTLVISENGLDALYAYIQSLGE